MRPPRLAERWLGAVIRDPHARAGVIGDLREDYERIARRYAVVVAYGWYWFAAAFTAGWYLRERSGAQPRTRAVDRGQGTQHLQSWWYDLRLAARAARRAPLFTTVAALTIAVGIGGTTAIFSVLDAVVLQPLPYDDDDRVVRITHAAPGAGVERMGATDGMYFQYGEHATTLSEFALYVEESVPSANPDEGAVEVGLISATPSLFRILGVTPALGRLFTEEESRPGSSPVVLLTHKFWMSRFAGDSTVVGKQLSDAAPIPIVGVLPAWFDFIRPEARMTFGNAFDEPDLFFPLRLNRARARFGNFIYQAVGRLAPGATLEEATNELAVLMHQMPALYPENGLTEEAVAEGGHHPIVEPFKDAMVGSVGAVVWMLMGAVSLVLLIAMVNIVNLFLVRTESRRREIAVRAALGAGSGALARSFLAEASLVAALGCLVGSGFAAVGTRLVLRLAPADVPRLDHVGFDVRVVVFTAAVAAMAALVLGLMPTAHYRRLSPGAVVSDVGRGHTGGRERHLTREAMVVTQVALALVLLIGSSLLIRTFWNMRNVSPGFGDTDALIVRVTLSANDPQERTDFMLQLTEQIEAIAGVEQAAFAGDLPLNGVTWRAGIALEGQEPARDAQAPRAYRNMIGPGYLRAIGATILQGREMTRQDYATDPDGVVVNRAFAAERWPGEDPIGKRLVQWPAAPGTWYRVIAVVADIHEVDLTETPEPTVYLPTVFRPGTMYGMFVSNFAIVIRTAGDPPAVLEDVRRVIAASDPSVPLTEVTTLAGLKADSMRQLSFAMVLLGIAGCAALLLGIVGIYGVVAYVVGQRTREFGVRIALGARAAEVRSMVLRQGGRVGAMGIGVGLVGALAVSRVLQSLLFDVAATDVFTYVAVSLALFVLVLGATLVPARRATRIDPVRALRAE